MPDVPDQLRAWSTSLADTIEPVHIERVTSSTTVAHGTSDTRRWIAVAASVLVVAAGFFA